MKKMKAYLILSTALTLFIFNSALAVDLPKRLSPKANVGKKLFFEPLFGKYHDYSCNSCHNVKKYCGADRNPKSPGFNVNAPTVFNVAKNKLYFWEGIRIPLKEAIEYHITSEHHLNIPKEELVKRVKENPALYKSVKSVYKKVDFPSIIDALSRYLKALTFETKIDKFLSGNNEILTKDEYEGYILFKNLGCRDCHTGKNFGGELKAKAHNGGDKVIRVPNLRFITCTQPYLHDGSKENLDDALNYIIETFIGVKLSEEEISKIKKFLKTLGE